MLVCGYTFRSFFYFIGMYKSAVEVNAKQVKTIPDVSVLKFMILSVVLMGQLIAMNVKPIAGIHNIIFVGHCAY